MSQLILQVNTAGAWKNVVEVQRTDTAIDNAKTAVVLLASASGSNESWRLVATRLQGSPKVICTGRRPHGWRQGL